MLDLLVCPCCQGPLVRDATELSCQTCELAVRVRDGIPRFATSPADPFGLQWTTFATTQLDSRSGLPISGDRFLRTLGPIEVNGKLVLDAGCGAGRFAEVALDLGAQVVAVDASSAVDACRMNLAGRDGLLIVQCDLHGLPFAAGSFDVVYCLGVLQHTPDPRAAFAALARHVRPGGALAIDVYPRTPLNALWPKYWLRPATRRIAPERLLRIVERAVPMLLRVSGALSRVPRVGRFLRYAVPVADYGRVYPLDAAKREEWAILDTFDMFAPAHDHPRSVRDVRSWFQEHGFQDVEVVRDGQVIGRGRR